MSDIVYIENVRNAIKVVPEAPKPLAVMLYAHIIHGRVCVFCQISHVNLNEDFISMKLPDILSPTQSMRIVS